MLSSVSITVVPIIRIHQQKDIFSFDGKIAKRLTVEANVVFTPSPSTASSNYKRVYRASVHISSHWFVLFRKGFSSRWSKDDFRTPMHMYQVPKAVNFPIFTWRTPTWEGIVPRLLFGVETDNQRTFCRDSVQSVVHRRIKTMSMFTSVMSWRKLYEHKRWYFGILHIPMGGPALWPYIGWRASSISATHESNKL